MSNFERLKACAEIAGICSFGAGWLLTNNIGFGVAWGILGLFGSIAVMGLIESRLFNKKKEPKN